MDDLRSVLTHWVGATIIRHGLLIWPDALAPEETDVQIYMDLALATGESASVQLRTGADGQTPQVDFGFIPDGAPIAALPERRTAWSESTFWTSHESYSHELFVITPEASSELNVLCGKRITTVYLVCFADDVAIATGICIECENAVRVWSIPGTYGNVVTMDVIESWWPAPVILVPV